ncbi:glutathione S-transferase 1-like [Planococcus citri]|uniref:glutathione S-transferase 1-like n=1 Tax=Planococcus citri TaxID=170843 RepID=UPI0031F919DD
MPVKLYYTVASTMVSPPIRAVVHTLKALNVPYELVNINLLQSDQLEKFLRINPQYTVPTIEDEDGFGIWDSHAINAYLANKYGKNDKLYPKDPKARAVVDQRLHFDNGVLFISLMNNINQIILKKTLRKVTNELKVPVEDSYNFLEQFLVEKQFIAGDDITIADFSILTTLTNLSVFVPVNGAKYPLITDYMKRCEINIPDFQQLEKEGKQSLIEVLKALNFEFNQIV